MTQGCMQQSIVRAAGITFFDCQGVRLLLEKTVGSKPVGAASTLYFTDPDGHTLALMREAPKGYNPVAA